jgi:TatD DNase family protein
MFDCHAHLDDELFVGDIDQVVKRAVDAGVSRIISVACDLRGATAVMSLAERHDCIAPCVGLHPEHYARLANRRNLPNAIDGAEAELDAVLQYIDQHHLRLAAVGECGLDFSPWILDSSDPEADKQRQRLAFAKQIDCAVRHQLPLNVHSRNAGRHAIDVLLQRAAYHQLAFRSHSADAIHDSKSFVPVLLHAFDGKASVALKGCEAGFFFSVPPSVCRSEHMQKYISPQQFHVLSQPFLINLF